MATITEDYCPKEIYRLLLEKGFDGEIHTTFDKEGYTQASITLQMAMKWLREVHNIGIFPSTYTITNSKGSKEEHVYGSAIVNLITFDLMCDDIMPRNSYEQAAEAAIKYSLENLI